nr:pentapeptide repeat-containing protein [Bacillus sp. JCM 19034]
MLNPATNYSIPNHLRSNCTNCFGLCCVALPYAKSADFPYHKDGGSPCRHLRANYSCAIHNHLREKGFRGCSVYECFGAGQKVSQYTYEGKDWRNHPDKANEMFQVFPRLQQLHEMLLYLHELLNYECIKPLHSEIRQTIDETEQLTNLSPKDILILDIPSHRAQVNVLLLEASKRIRAREKSRTRHSRNKGNDFIGANLRKANLRGANFRGALLIAADLRDADLRMSDMIGADLRDANLRGANMSDCLFLTQAQVQSANGDSHTKLPHRLRMPEHWKQASSSHK